MYFLYESFDELLIKKFGKKMLKIENSFNLFIDLKIVQLFNEIIPLFNGFQYFEFYLKA